MGIAAAAAVFVGAVVPKGGGARGGGVAAGTAALEGGDVTGLTGSSLPVIGRMTAGSLSSSAQLEAAVDSG